MIHPARKMGFAQLWDGLQAAKAEDLVTESTGPEGLRLFCYTRKCSYEKAWNEYTTLARGLILDPEGERVVATPFPKFFNVGEWRAGIPDLPFETFEKLDGSLIIIFSFRGEWHCATKGSFHSDQAKWAKSWLNRCDVLLLDKNATYLAEAIYPENRVVVKYNQTGLILLASYLVDGTEMPYSDLFHTSLVLGWKVTERHPFKSFSELVAQAMALPATQEGFVIRFSNGLRLKVKGEEYCRIHRAVSKITPLSVWEMMKSESGLDEFRKQIPEEFLADFDAIVGVLNLQLLDLLQTVRAYAEPVAHLSDKEVGLQIDHFPARVRAFIFPHRKLKKNGSLLSGRTRDSVFRAIRPDRNFLEGYEPSNSMNRVLEESK